MTKVPKADKCLHLTILIKLQIVSSFLYCESIKMLLSRNCQERQVLQLQFYFIFPPHCCNRPSSLLIQNHYGGFILQNSNDLMSWYIVKLVWLLNQIH